MRYRALLMDFYGTLVEEDDAIIDRIVETIVDRSPVPVDRRRVLASWRFGELCARSHGAAFRTQRALELESLQHLLREFGVDLDAESLSAELFRYWVAPAPYPSSARLLESMSVPVCLVSNIDSSDLAAAVGRLGWRFDHVVTSEDCRAYKPRPEPFQAALDVLGLRARDVLHVGDSLSSDVAGARALGIDCVWVNRRNRVLPPDFASRPTCEVSDVGEVVGLLR